MSGWRLGHPSLRKLQRWIDGDDVDLDRHLASCERCADRLESTLSESDAPIRSALLNVLVVPEELPDRLRTNIDERLSDQRDLTLIGEFFGLPFRTARAMTSTDQGDN